MGNIGRMDSNTQASGSPRPALLRQTQAVSGTWESSFRGNGVSSMSPVVQSRSGNRKEITMGNKNEGKGIFAPIVKVTRNVVGVKEFNQLRGKGIALHSQVRLTLSVQRRVVSA